MSGRPRIPGAQELADGDPEALEPRKAAGGTWEGSEGASESERGPAGRDAMRPAILCSEDLRDDPLLAATGLEIRTSPHLDERQAYLVDASLLWPTDKEQEGNIWRWLQQAHTFDVKVL